MKMEDCLLGTHILEAAQRAVDLVVGGEPEVSFDFNEITLIVKPGMTAQDVAAEYTRESEARAATYRASPEYKERQRQAELKEQIRANTLADILTKAPAKMSIKDEEGWAKWRASNTDGYGAATLRYAELWARVMEGKIASGVPIAECADATSHLADEEGITGFMYGCAVSILAQVWIHGEELRRWHNKETQIGTEGDKANETGGVLNPALLSIG